MDLLDINVWLALTDQNHKHHEAASAYWMTNGETEMAFSRISMLGLLRLSTHPRVLSRTFNAKEAWNMYQKFSALPHIHFLPEPPNLDQHFHTLSTLHDLPHHMWTDAYLAAFAIAGNHRLVSFDSDFSRFAELNFLHLKAT